MHGGKYFTTLVVLGMMIVYTLGVNVPMVPSFRAAMNLVNTIQKFPFSSPLNHSPTICPGQLNAMEISFKIKCAFINVW